MYIVAVFALIIVVIVVINEKSESKFEKYRNAKAQRTYGLVNLVKYYLYNLLIPSKESEKYKTYNKALIHLRISVEKFFTFKVLFSVILTILIIVINHTNTNLKIQGLFDDSSLFNSFYSDEVDTKIQKQVFNEAIKLDKSYFFNKDLEERGYEKLRIITSNMNLTDGQRQQLINSVYAAVNEYYNLKSISYSKVSFYILIILLSYRAPDLVLFIYKSEVKKTREVELNFLNKLIYAKAMNKNVTFSGLLKTLLEQSKYYKSILIKVDNINSNNASVEKSYAELIGELTDLEDIYFIEKLQACNMGEFTKAAKDIETDMVANEITDQYVYEQKKELVNSLGAMFAIILMTLVMYYGLKPLINLFQFEMPF